jgi:hypothetical protein
MAGSYVPTLEAYAIIADAVISQNNLTPSTTAYTNESVTFTQAMYIAIAALLPSWQTPPASLVVGKKVTIPSLVYTTSSSAALANSICLALNGRWTLTYSWSADQTELKMALADASDTANTVTLEVATNTTAKSTAFQILDTLENKLLLAVQRDSASTASGVFVSVDLGYAAGFAYQLWGYADNSGGLVTTEMTKPTTSTPETSKYIEEGFDGKGKLLFAETSTDDKNWTVSPSFDNTAPVSAYGTDMTAADSMTYSGESLL